MRARNTSKTAGSCPVSSAGDLGSILNGSPDDVITCVRRGKLKDGYKTVSEQWSDPHPSFLYTLCHHNDVEDIVLPHHPPEIVFGAGQRALGGDVLPAVVVPLRTQRCWCFRLRVDLLCVFAWSYGYVAGVDEVGAGVVFQVGQL